VPCPLSGLSPRSWRLLHVWVVTLCCCCCWGWPQDVGAVSLIRAVAPQLAIHGSTQMSITSAEGAEFAAGERVFECFF
jgi:hypothetical protein